MLINRKTRSAVFAAALAAGACASTASAQLVNGSFETPGPGLIIFQGWTAQFGNVFLDASAEVAAFDGVNSAKMFGGFIPGAQSDTGVQQNIPATAGAVYTLTTHALTPDFDPLAEFVAPPDQFPTGHLALGIIDFLDAGGGVIGSATVDAIVAGDDPTDTWIERSVEATAPVGTASANITLLLIQFDDPAGSIFCDDVSVTEGDAPATPCNGADLALPYGVLNFADVQTFLGLFGQGCN